MTQGVWAKRLKQARLAAQLSQRAVGVAAGIDEPAASTRINRYEVGVHAPDFETSVRIAAALNVPLAYFYCEDDGMAEIMIALHHADSQQIDRVRHALKLA